MLGAAIAICALLPQLGDGLCEHYGRLVDEAASAHAVPPALIVAVVTHESHWRHGVVNGKSGASGLGQIMPSTRPECRFAPASEACAAETQRLLDPAYNLRLVASRAWNNGGEHVTSSRPECRAGFRR